MESARSEWKPEETLLLSVDVVGLEQRNVAIRGWILDRTSSLKIDLKDNLGNPVGYRLHWNPRADVIRELELPEDTEDCGFEVLAGRDAIKGKTLVMTVKNDRTEKTYALDLHWLDSVFSERARLKKILSLKNLGKNLKRIARGGFRKFVYDVKMELNPNTTEYLYWMKAHQIKKKDLRAQARYSFAWQPRISIIIPVYNTPVPFLKDLLASVCGQSYANWELCLADASTEEEPGLFIRKHYGGDARIVYKRLKENGGISENTNRALEMAAGAFVMLTDQDDVLEKDALFEIVKALNQHPETDLLYTDEDKVTMDGQHYFEPHFKPDFNPGLLRSNNYICHITVVRKRLMDDIGGFRKEYDGAQDYDLVLRCVEKTTHIVHVPRVLYHWRSHPESTAVNPESKQYAFDAGRRALSDHYRRMGLQAEVEGIENMPGYYRTSFRVEGNPLVSVIIPSRDHAEDLDRCLESVFSRTDWDNFEVIIAENNSTEEETFLYYDRLKARYGERIRILKWEREFNYAAINNWAAAQAKGEFLLFLNNDTEIISPGWMQHMLGFCSQEDTAAVGAKLYYGDDTIQHAGVIVGICGVAGHIFCGNSRLDCGYAARARVSQDLSAVTAACMMVKASVFREVGGFEEAYAVAYNDVDLCMKIRSRGWRILFDPDSELYHYESKSRGLEDTPEKQERLQREAALFRDRWPDILKEGDPCYNRNLTDRAGDCSLREKYEDYMKQRR